MSSFPRNDVLAACDKYGVMLKVDHLDGPALMKAISSNESSVGANCGPRHEPAYDTGGSVYRSNAQQRQLVADFGPSAASSFGPWQMMFINFTRATPDQLLTDLDACAENFVRFFNSYVIGVRKAVTISEIGQVWNAGHISPNPSWAVQTYCEHLATAYQQFSGKENA